MNSIFRQHKELTIFRFHKHFNLNKEIELARINQISFEQIQENVQALHYRYRAEALEEVRRNLFEIEKKDETK